MTYFFVGFPYYFIPSPSSAPHFARSEAQQDLGGSGMLRLKPVFQLIEASKSRAATDFFALDWGDLVIFQGKTTI